MTAFSMRCDRGGSWPVSQADRNRSDFVMFWPQIFTEVPAAERPACGWSPDSGSPYAFSTPKAASPPIADQQKDERRGVGHTDLHD